MLLKTGKMILDGCLDYTFGGSDILISGAEISVINRFGSLVRIRSTNDGF